jgi:ABC-type transporter Mla subunit MlaD
MTTGQDIAVALQDLKLTLGHLHPLLWRLTSLLQSAGSAKEGKIDDLAQSLTHIAQALEAMAKRQEQVQGILLDRLTEDARLGAALAVMDKRISQTTDQIGRLETLTVDLIDELRGPP